MSIINRQRKQAWVVSFQPRLGGIWRAFFICYNHSIMSKETAKLRREVEILKAQLAGKQKTQKPAQPKREINSKGKEEQKFEETVDSVYIQKDLKRSLFITAGILILITTLYFSQPYWDPLINL